MSRGKLQPRPPFGARLRGSYNTTAARFLACPFSRVKANSAGHRQPSHVCHVPTPTPALVASLISFEPRLPVDEISAVFVPSGPQNLPLPSRAVDTTCPYRLVPSSKPPHTVPSRRQNLSLPSHPGIHHCRHSFRSRSRDYQPRLIISNTYFFQ